jgi:hypothetical protein
VTAPKPKSKLYEDTRRKGEIYKIKGSFHKVKGTIKEERKSRSLIRQDSTTRRKGEI